MDTRDVIIGESKVKQFPHGKGVFANRDFKKGEIVIQYKLKPITKKEFENLPEDEKEYTHIHWGQIYLYPLPERYVNTCDNPNTLPDLKRQCDVAIKDIKKGEEITTDNTLDDIE